MDTCLGERYDKLVELAQKKYDAAKKEVSANEKEKFKNYPHLFVLTCLFDRQTSSDIAKITEELSEKFGGNNFEVFINKNPEEYKTVWSELSHRPRYIKPEEVYSAIKRIKDEYDSDAGKIWSDNPHSATLVMRFLEFYGIGPKISSMAANILVRDYDVKVKDKSCIDISSDVHVKRVFYRLGLVKYRKQTEPEINFNQEYIDNHWICLKAREINPEFPGLLDHLCWTIGKSKTCVNKLSNCKCEECPLNDMCEKNQ